MSPMPDHEATSAIPSPDMEELKDTLDRALRGLRDPAAMDRAAERMDRMREEMRRRIGAGEWAVPLTRETRDEE